MKCSALLSIANLVLRGKTEALRAFEPPRDEQFRDPETKSYLDAFAKAGKQPTLVRLPVSQRILSDTLMINSPAFTSSGC